MGRRQEKETAVYEAVFRLLEQGERLYSVTVQQIADAAGIGKGTVYEYFSSREEILSKALLYRVRAELDTLQQRLTRQPDFASGMDIFFGFAQQAVHSGASGVHTLFASLQIMAPPRSVCTAMQQSGLAQELAQLAFAVLEAGVHEKRFPPITDKDYALQVFLSAVVGYANAFRAVPGGADDALRANAVRMLCQALA